MDKIIGSAIYLGDNGRCYCGDHLGMTAKATGRDLSGQKIHRCTREDAVEIEKLGVDLICEHPTCGRQLLSAMPIVEDLVETKPDRWIYKGTKDTWILEVGHCAPFEFASDNYDGSGPDYHDSRCGFADCLEDCLEQIFELEDRDELWS